MTGVVARPARRIGEICLGLGLGIAIGAAAGTIGAALVPDLPPEPHYCFRGDQPPCLVSVR